MNTTQSNKTSTIVIGGLLIAAGILVLAGRSLSWLNLEGLWPLIVIGVGAALFAAMLLGGKPAGGLAIPASIVATVGLILLVVNETGAWQIWSYAWALIISGIGIGITIQGIYSGIPERKARGLRVMRTGLVLFLIFGIVFESLYSLLNISVYNQPLLWPAALILLSGYLFVSNVITNRRADSDKKQKSLFWPVILLGCGVLALLVGAGILTPMQLLVLLNLWPVMMIAAGLQLLVHGSSAWYGAALGVLVVAGMLVLAFFGAQLGFSQSPDWFVLYGEHPGSNGQLINIGGTGDMIEEERPAGDFDQVKLILNSRLEIIQGDTPALTIRADENLLPYITTRTIGDTLEIGTKNGYHLIPGQKILVQLTVVDLKSLETTGYGDIDIQSLETDDLRIETDGAGPVQIDDLQADYLSVQIDGAGSIKLDGTAGHLDTRINGAGTLLAENLECKAVEVQIDGFGNATVWAVDQLFVKINGTGNVTYYGRPDVNRDINGLGFVKNLGTK